MNSFIIKEDIVVQAEINLIPASDKSGKTHNIETLMMPFPFFGLASFAVFFLYLGPK